ncbi:MAG: hypothetical protein LUQ22_01470, partial [Methanotrichaceae archaeon]|nr:hypothetical protein [Methanotrichaceae archaeon]
RLRLCRIGRVIHSRYIGGLAIFKRSIDSTFSKRQKIDIQIMTIRKRLIKQKTPIQWLIKETS